MTKTRLNTILFDTRKLLKKVEDGASNLSTNYDWVYTWFKLMGTLHLARAYISDWAKSALEILLAIVAFILFIAALAVLVGGVVFTVILGWRAIIALALAALTLIVIVALLSAAILAMLKLGKEEDDKENEWGV